MTDATKAPRPAPAHHERRSSDLATRAWTGAKRDYDLVREFVIAVVVVGLLTALLALLFSSPDEKAITLKSWADNATSDFVSTVAQELAGTSGSAGYGQPYNDTADAAQHIGPLNPQKWAGVRIPVDSANAFVIRPLSAMPKSADTAAALAAWKSASAEQQATWAGDFADALDAAEGDLTKVATGDYGPVPALVAAELEAAKAGALDGVVQQQGKFYQLNYTYSLLFLADGTYLEDRAVAEHLGGGQWGMMNETGSYPGQSWLWLYSFWYQIKPFNDETTTLGASADAYIWAIMMVLSLGFLLVPFIPGVRSLPRWIPIHRLIWRDYYRAHPRT